jgi:hypothetical protein
MASGEMGSEDYGSKERKGLQEICGRPIYATCHSLQRRHHFLPVTRGPAVPVLMTDEMRRRDQVNESKDDAQNEKMKFRSHIGGVGINSSLPPVTLSH